MSRLSRVVFCSLSDVWTGIFPRLATTMMPLLVYAVLSQIVVHQLSCRCHRHTKINTQDIPMSINCFHLCQFSLWIHCEKNVFIFVYNKQHSTVFIIHFIYCFLELFVLVSLHTEYILLNEHKMFWYWYICIEVL